MLSRRGLLTGIGSLLVCAPAIVRASSLMPVKVFDAAAIDAICRGPYDVTMEELIAGTRRTFQPRLWVQAYQSTPLLRAALLDIGVTP